MVDCFVRVNFQQLHEVCVDLIHSVEVVVILFEELEGANLRHVRVDVFVGAARDREPVTRPNAVRLRPRVEPKRGPTPLT